MKSSSNPEIKAIIFDCFGVLYSEVFASLRLKYPEHLKEYWALSNQDDLGDITPAEFVETFIEKSQVPAEEAREVVQQARIAARKNTELLDLIKRLRESYKTSVLSNVGRGFFEEIFSDQERSEYFDDVVLSNVVGMIKPHRDIFELAASRLGVELEQCVFVDDSQTNIDAATSYGMHGILYKDFADFQQQLNQVL